MPRHRSARDWLLLGDKVPGQLLTAVEDGWMAVNQWQCIVDQRPSIQLTQGILIYLLASSAPASECCDASRSGVLGRCGPRQEGQTRTCFTHAPL